MFLLCSMSSRLRHTMSRTAFTDALIAFGSFSSESRNMSSGDVTRSSPQSRSR
jgi:hypothetical protein